MAARSTLAAESTTDRDTEVARKDVPELTRLRIWAAAAGRCILCSTWLLDGRDYFWHAIPVGQVAHIVGASAGKNAPRGQSDLTVYERALEGNLLLLCYSCHKRIDDRAFRDTYTVAFLAEKKRLHETRVRQVTDFATLRPTSVIRLTGDVRGTRSPASLPQVAEALRREDLTGMGDDTRNGLFDLNLSGSHTDSWVWDAHRSDIDKFTDRIAESVAAGDVSSLSVFALAPIPSLIYFGSRLDDKTETRLFARKRSDAVTAWAWDEGTDESSFDVSVTEADKNATMATVFVDVSAPISRSAVPDDLRAAPNVLLQPMDATPSPDLLNTPASLDAFGRAWRDLLALAERELPNVTTLHVFAAVPVVAAITMGRHHMRGAHPDLVLYERVNDTYNPVMEVQR